MLNEGKWISSLFVEQCRYICWNLGQVPCCVEGRSSSKKWVIIGGVVGGAALVAILLLLFPWRRRPQSPKRVAGGKTIWKVLM